ncbi:deoxyhypusine synthase [Cynoglossus semilaevis]|nr:deoxyhypusine synthase [Cynoglossus semilaevis]XP_024920254.1 deoxyhypusine synthase [Cynoglossus semilaevis]
MALPSNKYPYRETEPIPEDTPKVRGYDFNQGVDYQKLLQSFLHTGFQATHVAMAIQQIIKMIELRKEPVQNAEGKSLTSVQGCTIFLSYTSNMVSSGVREIIRYLAQHKMVDVLVTTAGGIEEDLIKCLGSVYVGDFALSGKVLHTKGLDRIGNLLMPDQNYQLLENWLIPIMGQMLLEQNTQGVRWTPSKMIHRMGKEINNPDSIYYWAYKNDIPVFSPALTDGAIGDLFYCFLAHNPGLILDIAEDFPKIINVAVNAKKRGIIVLGGGLAKHHTCNANAWAKGADYAVFVNTGQEFDGSDSGARPDEAVSWGKVRVDAKPVKIFADATVIFPLLVAETFAVHADKKTEDSGI